MMRLIYMEPALGDIEGILDYVSQDFAQYDGEGDTIGLQTGTWDQAQLDIISDITVGFNVK